MRVHYFKGLINKLGFKCMFKEVILMFFTKTVTVSGGFTNFQAALYMIMCLYIDVEDIELAVDVSCANYFHHL